RRPSVWRAPEEEPVGAVRADPEPAAVRRHLRAAREHPRDAGGPSATAGRSGILRNRGRARLLRSRRVGGRGHGRPRRRRRADRRVSPGRRRGSLPLPGVRAARPAPERARGARPTQLQAPIGGAMPITRDTGGYFGGGNYALELDGFGAGLVASAEGG